MEDWPVGMVRVKGRVGALGSLTILSLLAVVGMSLGLGAFGHSVAAPADAEDWPVAVDVGHDGRVWLAMRTDVPSLGGLARYSDGLKFESAWGLEGPAQALGHGPDGHVYAGEIAVDSGTEGPSRISRFEPEGGQQGSNPLEGEARALALDLLGSIFVLEQLPVPDMPPRQRVAQYAWHGSYQGTLIEHTWPYFVIDVGASAADEWIYVATASDNIGAEGRVTGFRLPQATARNWWRTPGQPIALSVDVTGRVFVADMGVEGGGQSFPYRFIVYDALGAELWRCPVEDASIVDIAAGLEGQAYLLLDPRDQGRRQLRRYGPDCALLDWIDRFEPVQGLSRPLTATPGPTSSSTPTPGLSTPTPTPSPSPSNTPITPSPTPITLTPTPIPPSPTPSITPSTTPSPTTTPGRTCTPPPCPCGPVVGICPMLRCICAETPRPAYLPILAPR
jgi:hypothetical protein